MYFPKSQIETDLYTAGAEFRTVTDSQEYIGNYWRTSQGLYFSGKNPQDNNVQPLQKTLTNDTPRGGKLEQGNDDNENYINLSPNAYIASSGRRIREKVSVVKTGLPKMPKQSK